jgi:uncharacterized surface protein with fasciclin (FAS1) repeats
VFQTAPQLVAICRAASGHNAHSNERVSDGTPQYHLSAREFIMRIFKLFAAAAAIALTSPALAATGTIPVVATQAGQFTTLVAALKAAGLVETLAGKGPFTVFAPTDAAFAKLPAGTVKSLLEPANKAKLTAILTYHVVPGKTLSPALAGKVLTVKTVEGASLKIDGTGSSVKVNNATVIGADVAASNGVIHVIDTVLMPPM